MSGSDTRVWRILLLVLLLGGALAGTFYHRGVRQTELPSAGHVILYYRDPMHPSYTSDKPGTAPDCGMALEPVYEMGGMTQRSPAQSAPDLISINPEKLQLIGVVLGSVVQGPLTRTIRALGRIAIDESRIFPVTAGADGVVRRVFLASTDTEVRQGHPLVSIYGREYLTVQRTYLYGLRNAETARAPNLDYQDQPAFALEEARLNLLDLGFGQAQVEQIARERKPLLDVVLAAPGSGTILARNAYAQQRFNRGTELFRIADLSRVWIVVDLFGEDAHSIRGGVSADVLLPDWPQARVRATVTDAQPRFDAVTRALTVRLEMANPRMVCRPDMRVDVEFFLPSPQVISVPAEAVLDSGLRKMIFVNHGSGRFEARAIETGARFGERVEIVHGLRAGESIVVSGNFLLDSESRMRAPSARTAADPHTVRETRHAGARGHD